MERPDAAQDRATDPPPLSLRKEGYLMSVIFLLITASTLVAGIFLAAFIRAVRNGQFDDDRSPAVRMLHDDRPPAERSDRTPETVPNMGRPNTANR